MKPLLRAVLILDALILLAFGLLFLLTPWKSLYDALHLMQTDPVLVGQGFGIALVGLAWLALHASVDGAMTATVAKVVGHVNWLTGVLMLVWLVGLHTPPLAGLNQLVAVVTGAVLLVIGLGGVRLASAVRRRDRRAGTAAAERADRVAARDTANEVRKAGRERDATERPAGGYAPGGPRAVEPTLGEMRSTNTASPVNPVAGRPVEPDLMAPLTRSPGAAAGREDALARERAAAADEEAAARERAAADPKSGTPRPPFHG